MGYPQRVRIIILNLVRNAIDAMRDLPPGSARQLGLNVSRANEFAQVDVRDSGSGIPADMLTRMFQSGFTTKGEKGTGLGLYLSHQLALACEGSLTASNKSDGGAIFCLRLPLTFE